jgi:hypothetical protein
MSTPAQRRVTLAEVEQQARKDLAIGGPTVTIDWAFRHARAVARAAEAEQAWKAFDADRCRMFIDIASDIRLSKPATYDALTMVTASLHSAAADLGEARAIEVACGHVLRLLEQGVKVAASPHAKPRAA